jgi:hypothetical protein
VPFLDELASGIAPASTPDLATLLGVSGGATAAAILVAFHSLAFFVEAPLLAWSERVSARWFSAASLGVLGLASFAAAWAPKGWLVLLALAVYGPASGASLAVAEGVLVESEPRTRERTLARLALAANAGDLAVPLLLAVLAWAGAGWRSAFLVAGGIAVGLAVVHASTGALERRLEPGVAGEDASAPEEAPTLGETVRTALASRGLVGWSLAAAATNLLDEVLVAFAAVHIEAIGGTAAARSWAVAAWVVGGFVGLAGLERWSKRAAPRHLMLGASLATAAWLALLAGTRSPDVAIAAFGLLGVAGSTLHPLAKAQAYAALPGRPALVNAVASALLPLEMAAPVLLAVLERHGGSSAAVVGIGLAPLAVAVAAWRLERSDRCR